jgi:hypothetical protein
MTQTQPDRLDQLESFIERMDSKLDTIASDLREVKLFQARTDEQLRNLGFQVSGLKVDLKADITDIKTQLRSQDNRLWGFVAAVFLTVFGFVAKFAFFPGGQP